MTRYDYLAILFAAVLLPWLYFSYWGNESQGEVVEIRAVGGKVMTLPLDYNKRVTIQGALGPSIIEIHDRQVRFVESPCLEKRCIITGWLKKDGETAACLPNGITVRIIGRDNRFDAVNF